MNGSIGSEYCLYCYAPLARTQVATQRCARCGRLHLKADQRVFWSKEPRLRRVEAITKLLVLVFMAALFLAIYSALGMGGQPVIVFFVGPLLMFGGLLWWTVGFLTRKPRYFSPRTLWVSVFGMLVVGTPVLLFLLDVIARKESFGPEYWEAYLVLASPALPMAVIGLGLHFLGKTFDAFKRRRIAAGGW